MPSHRQLVTLFARQLLSATDPHSYAHLTLHLPLQLIIGHYRCTHPAGTTTLAFHIGLRHCLGHASEERTDEFWDGPRLLAWTRLSEYSEPLPKAEPWSVLLPLFTTVALHTSRGTQSCSGAAVDTGTLYRVFA